MFRKNFECAVHIYVRRRSSSCFVANIKKRSESYCRNSSFFFVRANESVICICDIDRRFAGKLRLAARCRVTVRFKLLIGGRCLNTAVDAVPAIQCLPIVVLDSSPHSQRH